MFQLSSLNEKLCSESRHVWVCANNSSSVSSVFCRRRLVSKSCFSPISGSKQQYWRDTIKALQGLKESTEKNSFSLRMNCVMPRRWRSLLLLPRYKMQIVNQVWWLTKEGKRKKITGGKKDAAHLIAQLKSSGASFEWRVGEVKRLKSSGLQR